MICSRSLLMREYHEGFLSGKIESLPTNEFFGELLLLLIKLNKNTIDKKTI